MSDYDVSWQAGYEYAVKELEKWLEVNKSTCFGGGGMGLPDYIVYVDELTAKLKEMKGNA